MSSAVIGFIPPSEVIPGIAIVSFFGVASVSRIGIDIVSFFGVVVVSFFGITIAGIAEDLVAPLSRIRVESGIGIGGLSRRDESALGDKGIFIAAIGVLATTFLDRVFFVGRAFCFGLRVGDFTLVELSLIPFIPPIDCCADAPEGSTTAAVSAMAQKIFRNVVRLIDD